MASPAINPPPMQGMGMMGGNSQMMSDVPVSSPTSASAGAGGAKMVYRVVEGLKSIASAYPDVSGDVDEIIQKVERLALTLMSQGSQGQAPPVPYASPSGAGESAPF